MIANQRRWAETVALGQRAPDRQAHDFSMCATRHEDGVPCRLACLPWRRQQTAKAARDGRAASPYAVLLDCSPMRPHMEGRRGEHPMCSRTDGRTRRRRRTHPACFPDRKCAPSKIERCRSVGILAQAVVFQDLQEFQRLAIASTPLVVGMCGVVVGLIGAMRHGSCCV